MKVTCIDFETANSFVGSICAVGLAVIEDGQFVATRYWLVKPHSEYCRFDYWNIKVHGIRPSDVAHAQEFDAIYAEMLPMMEGAVIAAHNAVFDISALRKALDLYGLPYPTTEYLCTCRVAKKAWPDLQNHRLNTVAAHLGHTFVHHNALEDAVACGTALLAALADAGVDTTHGLLEQFSLRHGTLFPGGYTPCGAVPKPRRAYGRNKGSAVQTE